MLASTDSVVTELAAPRSCAATTGRILIVLVLGVAYAPLLIDYAGQLWRRPHYQFFPGFLIGLAGLAWFRWRAADLRLDLTRVRAPLSAAMIFLAALLAGAAVLLASSWLGAVSILVLAGGALLVTSAPARYELWPVWISLWLLIYPPLGLDHQVIQWLQRHVAETASGQLDLFQIHHLPSVASLDFPGRKLVVEDACSGMWLSFALVACSVLAAIGARLGAFPAACLIVAAVFWGYVWNVVCVICLAVTYDFAGSDLSVGWRQGVLETAVFLAALGLIASTYVLIRTVCVPVRLPIWERGPILRIWNWLVRSRQAPNTMTRSKSAAAIANSKSKSIAWTMAAVGALVIYFIVAGVQLTSRFGGPAVIEQFKSMRQMIRDSWIGDYEV